jgi:hypothetical protein
VAFTINIAESNFRHTQWLSAATSDPNAVARFLTEASLPTYALLSAIARKMQPDTVPNDYGIDPWLKAIRSIDARQEAEPEEF